MSQVQIDSPASRSDEVNNIAKNLRVSGAEAEALMSRIEKQTPESLRAKVAALRAARAAR